MLEMMEMTEPNILSKLQEDTRTKEEVLKKKKDMLNMIKIEKMKV